MIEGFVEQVLETIGLPAKDIEVYVFLSKQGHMKCEEIARNLKKSRSQVYEILRNLERRNTLESTLQHPTLYGAISLDKVLDIYIKEKQRDALLLRRARKEILKQWGNVLKKGQTHPAEKITIIEGKNKIYPRILQMVENTKGEFLLLNNGSDLGRSFQLDFDQTILRLSKRRNVRALILLQENSVWCREMMETLRSSLGQGNSSRLFSRFLRSVLKCNMRFIVKDSEEAIFFTKFSGNPFSMEETCVWTNSNALINVLRTLFEMLWSNADSSTSVKESLRNCRGSTKSLEEIGKWYTCQSLESLTDNQLQ